MCIGVLKPTKFPKSSFNLSSKKSKFALSVIRCFSRHVLSVESVKITIILNAQRAAYKIQFVNIVSKKQILNLKSNLWNPKSLSMKALLLSSPSSTDSYPKLSKLSSIYSLP